MPHVLIRRLEMFSAFTEGERSALLAAVSKNVRSVAARRDVVREGAKPSRVTIVLEGWACRYKQLPDGRRQILSIQLPGDICDANIFILEEMDHSIGALTNVSLADVPPDQFSSLARGYPRIAEALWWEELVCASIQREWIFNVAQRSAIERLAHLLCEIFLRMRSIGLASETECEFPLTQSDLADATGLTAVHVNRTLQQIRRTGIVRLNRRRLQILDLEALQRLSLFNPNYLHLKPAQKS